MHNSMNASLVLTLIPEGMFSSFSYESHSSYSLSSLPEVCMYQSEIYLRIDALSTIAILILHKALFVQVCYFILVLEANMLPSYVNETLDISNVWYFLNDLYFPKHCRYHAKESWYLYLVELSLFSFYMPQYTHPKIKSYNLSSLNNNKATYSPSSTDHTNASYVLSVSLTYEQLFHIPPFVPLTKRTWPLYSYYCSWQ